mgnify:CR=1 FL=1
MRGLTNEQIDRMLAANDVRPAVMELGICEWPRDVFDTWIAQDYAQCTHHVPSFTVRALDGRDLAACGVPVNAEQIAPSEHAPTCIACAIACGADPDEFINKERAA